MASGKIVPASRGVVPEAIQPDSRYGCALSLPDSTWFRGANACFARPLEVEATGKAFPLELYSHLVQLVRDRDAAVQAREDAAGR